MLGDISIADNIYIVTGYTDMRKAIDGLCAIILNQMQCLQIRLKGATASATIYSIIETAKANGLNVYTYLEFLLMYMPDTDWRNHPEDLEDLMPWSQMAQEICKR